LLRSAGAELTVSQPDSPMFVTVVFAVWIVLGVSSGIFFFGSKNAKLKRRVFSWFIIFVGALFSLFAFLASNELGILLIVVPAVVVISYLNYHMTKFLRLMRSDIDPPGMVYTGALLFPLRGGAWR
jgi:hypothetical protein